MSHVICTPAAAAVIKTYSPNLMVHPLIYDYSDRSLTHEMMKEEDKEFSSTLSRLHVLVIGPGLGRTARMQNFAASALTEARKRNMPVVVDADALLLVPENDGKLVKGWKDCVLTPNVVEFKRLADAFEVDVNAVSDGEGCKRLAAALGGVTVLRKGDRDWISDGEVVTCCSVPGGRKRSGGQGDTLTGVLATWLAWRKAWSEGLWKDSGRGMSEKETLLAAVWAGSALARESSRRAFEKHGRSMQAHDLTGEVHGAFLALFGSEEERESDS